jgi:hypothetical protein
VYFQDATSYATKVSYLTSRHPGIAGFAHWRAGAEDPAIWAEVATLKSGASVSVPAAPAPQDFAINGPAAMVMNRGTSQDATFTVSPINGFSATASVSASMLDAFNGSVTTSGGAAPGSPATVHVTAGVAALPGTYRIRVTMTSGSLTHDTTVSVTIAATRSRAVGKR